MEPVSEPDLPDQKPAELPGDRSGDFTGEFVRHLGVHMTEVSGDRVVAEWEAGSKHHQPYGIVHGGVHCSVVETLASVGAAMWLGQQGQVVGVNNNTDFYRAVEARADENVAFSWIEWPDKAARDAGNKKVMEDPRMDPAQQGDTPMPFDGQRMIYGGFIPVVELRA